MDRFYTSALFAPITTRSHQTGNFAVMVEGLKARNARVRGNGWMRHRMTAVFKRVPLHDHIPKLCREKCSNALHELLTAVCCDSGDPAHWCRLFLFFPYVLQKPARGGRRVNQGNQINKRLSEYSTIEVTSLLSGFENHINANPRGHNPDRWINAVSSCIEQGNVSAAVLKAIKSFGNGSSGGLDGLRPQHLKDLLSGPLPIDDLLIFLTKFINLVLSGASPPTFRGTSGFYP
ncbi:hypothetical protein HELRODRAFT_174250 [Helobdella robusta]|uniref:Reverse transcriptase domain-containing protein n=1 Tax=Helobdella robusta TaxID=6412 RepID=T1F7V9_HELRO|nr:hypothetical protein HELRODRAFT_174250 [Helobdella robusta]ESO02826.1 hypothetical protein HELRODRAFT_174250 [Helobdella robusta]